MTFGIAFASQHYVGILTDRLLSGSYSAEDSDKCGVVLYSDGRFCYTFAGIAEVPRHRFKASNEIARALGEAGKPESEGADPARTRDALARVAETMSSSVSRLLGVDRRMSILIVGFRQVAQREVPEIYLISNFEQLEGPESPTARDYFTVEGSEGRTISAGLAWIGSHFRARLRSPILDRLERSRNIPPWEIVRLLTREIRRVAATDGDRVGRNCSALTIVRDSGRIEVGYHSEKQVDRAAATAFIEARYGNHGAFYRTEQWLRGARFKGASVFTSVSPPAHKRLPCPCNSGRPYKNCHGNSRNSTQMDSYSLSTAFVLLAMPDDGSEVDIFSTDMIKR